MKTLINSHDKVLANQVIVIDEKVENATVAVEGVSMNLSSASDDVAAVEIARYEARRFNTTLMDEMRSRFAALELLIRTQQQRHTEKIPPLVRDDPSSSRCSQAL